MKLTLLPLEKNDVLRVRCDGRISLRAESAPGDPLQDLLGPRCFGDKVLLDLEGAQGIDTSGVCWLMELFEKFAAARGQLVVYSVPPTVTQFLDVLRLTHLHPLAVNESAAREQLARDPNAPPALVGRPPAR
jgi:anti-anti-sigma regulatory factor